MFEKDVSKMLAFYKKIIFIGIKKFCFENQSVIKINE